MVDGFYTSEYEEMDQQSNGEKEEQIMEVTTQLQIVDCSTVVLQF